MDLYKSLKQIVELQINKSQKNKTIILNQERRNSQKKQRKTTFFQQSTKKLQQELNQNQISKVTQNNNVSYMSNQMMTMENKLQQYREILKLHQFQSKQNQQKLIQRVNQIEKLNEGLINQLNNKKADGFLQKKRLARLYRCIFAWFKILLKNKTNICDIIQILRALLKLKKKVFFFSNLKIHNQQKNIQKQNQKAMHYLIKQRQNNFISRLRTNHHANLQSKLKLAKKQLKALKQQIKLKNKQEPPKIVNLKQIKMKPIIIQPTYKQQKKQQPKSQQTNIQIIHHNVIKHLPFCSPNCIKRIYPHFILQSPSIGNINNINFETLIQQPICYPLIPYCGCSNYSPMNPQASTYINGEIPNHSYEIYPFPKQTMVPFYMTQKGIDCTRKYYRTYEIY